MQEPKIDRDSISSKAGQDTSGSLYEKSGLLPVRWISGAASGLARSSKRFFKLPAKWGDGLGRLQNRCSWRSQQNPIEKNEAAVSVRERIIANIEGLRKTKHTTAVQSLVICYCLGLLRTCGGQKSGYWTPLDWPICHQDREEGRVAYRLVWYPCSCPSSLRIAPTVGIKF